MSHYPKILLKMNTYLSGFITYFDHVIHPAGGKSELQKNKRKSGKKSNTIQASPDSMNMRASLRADNGVRRNPAP